MGCGDNGSNNKYLSNSNQPIISSTPTPTPTISDNEEVGHIPSESELANDPIVSVFIPLNASTLGENAFGVNPLIIPLGTIVKWVNNDVSSHTSTSSDGYWDSSTINPGETYYFLFEKIGIYNYLSTTDTMTGTISVAITPQK
jgi:plastocyanin